MELTLEQLIEDFHNPRKGWADKEGIARMIIRVKYPDYVFSGKSLKQVLALAHSIIRKEEVKNNGRPQDT